MAQFLQIFVDKNNISSFPIYLLWSSFSYTWINIKQPIHFVYCNLLFFFYQDPFGCCCFLVIRWCGISCMLILQQQFFGVERCDSPHFLSFLVVFFIGCYYSRLVILSWAFSCVGNVGTSATTSPGKEEINNC